VGERGLQDSHGRILLPPPSLSTGEGVLLPFSRRPSTPKSVIASVAATIFVTWAQSLSRRFLVAVRAKETKRNVLRYGIHDCSMGSSVAMCMSDPPPKRRLHSIRSTSLHQSVGSGHTWNRPPPPVPSLYCLWLSLLRIVVPIPLAILFRSGLGLVDLVKSYRRSAVIHSRITKTHNLQISRGPPTISSLHKKRVANT